jgi:hypothetical protein
MVKIKEGWSASSPLIQKETERFDDGCLASVVFSQQDVHARSELDGQIGKAPEGGLMPTFSMPSLLRRSTPAPTDSQPGSALRPTSTSAQSYLAG